MSDFDDKFDKRFQQSLLAHYVRDAEFLTFAKGQVKPELFSSEVQQRLVRLVNDFYDKEKSAPNTLIYQVVSDWKSKGVLSDEQVVSLTIYIAELLALPLQNKAYIKNEFNRFAKEQLFRTNIIPITNLVKKGDFEKAEEKLKEIFSFSVRQELDLGRAFISDPSVRISRREQEDQERFWLLIPELDRCIQGGKRGELWLWQSAKSSGGKSAALVHLTRSFVFQKKRILIYSMEMSEESYEDRLDSNICGLSKDMLTDRIRIESKLRKLFRQGHQIWIKQFPNGVLVDDLREHKRKLEAIEGFYADAVLVDYLDLLSIPREEKYNSHTIYKKVSEQLRAWAVEEKVLVWSATQSNAAGMEAKLVDQQHVAGSKGKVYTCDGLIGINRTPEEQKQGLCNLNVVKNRDGAAGIVVKIRQDFSKMAFYLPSE